MLFNKIAIVNPGYVQDPLNRQGQIARVINPGPNTTLCHMRFKDDQSGEYHPEHLLTLLSQPTIEFNRVLHMGYDGEMIAGVNDLIKEQQIEEAIISWLHQIRLLRRHVPSICWPFCCACRQRGKKSKVKNRMYSRSPCYSGIEKDFYPLNYWGGKRNNLSRSKCYIVVASEVIVGRKMMSKQNRHKYPVGSNAENVNNERPDSDKIIRHIEVFQSNKTGKTYRVNITYMRLSEEETRIKRGIIESILRKGYKR